MTSFKEFAKEVLLADALVDPVFADIDLDVEQEVSLRALTQVILRQETKVPIVADVVKIVGNSEYVDFGIHGVDSNLVRLIGSVSERRHGLICRP